MQLQIKKAAVLGSGVMGSGIAALLANVGIPVRLLDIVPGALTEAEAASGFTLSDKIVRNRLATAAVHQLTKQKPAPLTTIKNLSLIEVGNFEDDLHQLADCDWIIEVVVENIDVKRSVLAKIDQVRKSSCIVSSNTSGISVNAMVKGCSESLRKHFLGTHFFNPPRYLQLVEIIPTDDTDDYFVRVLKQFIEEVLGKGVVLAKDTPNFIANRIGTYGIMLTIQEMQRWGLTVGEVDSLTGPLLNRPKSATFRTLDVVGLDTFSLVLANLTGSLPLEKAILTVPTFMQELTEKGHIGSKAGAGFYKKVGKDILEIDWKTGQYGPKTNYKSTAVSQAKQAKDYANKLQTLVEADDPAGHFLWSVLSGLFHYAATCASEIADDIVSIDAAMKWGFGWEYGIFETWDAIGLVDSVARMEAEGYEVPTWIKGMLGSGQYRFYQDDEHYFTPAGYMPKAVNEKELDITILPVIKENSGGRLRDMGDGIAFLEFCSPNDAIGIDFMEMIVAAITEVEANYEGLVIGNTSKNFCVGANLALMLMAAQDDDLYEINQMVKKFQQATTAIKYCSKPVVSAPYQMTLGGGAELCLPAIYCQAASETYIGLVEVGVGLIPAGGGCKELYVRNLQIYGGAGVADLQKVAQKTFETIALAKVSTSAAEASETGFLRAGDGVSMNVAHLLYEAKQATCHLVTKGYRAPVKSKIPVSGEVGYAALTMGAQVLLTAGHISEHDFLIAKKLAWVVSGGNLPYGTEVDEQYLLDLEREAFNELIVTPKTQARMQHMLVTKKPLRN